jgi:O-antigen/teichoic acid export membrane protein
VVPALVLLIFTPVLIHSMGTANYGLWAISLAGFGLLGVAELGLGVAIAKYVAEYRQANDTVGLSSTASAGLALYLLIAVLFTVPLYLAADTIAQLFSSSELAHAQVEHVVQLVSLGLLPLLLTSWGLAIAVGLQRFQIPMLVAVAQSGLTVVIAVVVVWLGGSVDDVVLSSLCVLCAVALASAATGVRMLAPLGARPMLSVRFVRRLLPYVFFTSVSSLGSILFGSVDRIAVGAVIDLRAAAYYAVSIGIATKLLSLTDVLTRPLMPASSSLQRAGEIDLVRRQLRVATTGVTALSTALGAILFVLAEPLLRIWLGSDFAEHALSTFRVLVVVYALIAIVAPSYHVANGIGYPWICAAGAIVGGVATIALIVVFGRHWGVVGAAWANAAYLVTLVIPVYIFAALARLRLPTRVAPAPKQ